MLSIRFDMLAVNPSNPYSELVTLDSERVALDFQRQPGHLIRRCLQLHHTMFADGVAGHTITVPQWAAIRALHEFPGIEQAKLSELVAYDRSTIGGLVDRLEAKRAGRPKPARRRPPVEAAKSDRERSGSLRISPQPCTRSDKCICGSPLARRSRHS